MGSKDHVRQAVNVNSGGNLLLASHGVTRHMPMNQRVLRTYRRAGPSVGAAIPLGPFSNAANMYVIAAPAIGWGIALYKVDS